MSYTRLQKVIRKMGSGVLVFTLALSFSLGASYTGSVEEVAAFDINIDIGSGDEVFDASNFLKNTVDAASSAISAGVDKSLLLKEFTLDPLLYSIGKKLLQQGTQSVVSWINSGFNGGPAFVTDLAQHLVNAADDVAVDFILGSELDAMCEPFQADVQAALVENYQEERDFTTKSECSLSGSGADQQSFFSGNFQNGGWEQWFQIILNPQNNIYGATGMAADHLAALQEQRIEKEKAELDWGNGFFSVKVCPDGSIDGDCPITTPGSVLSENLNFKLTLGDRSLIEADEMNEIISAMMNQLGEQAITGVNGLLGLSQSHNGMPSFLQELGTNYDGLGGSSDSQSGFIVEAMKNEVQYRGLHQPLLTEVNLIATQASSTTCVEGRQIAANAQKIRTALKTEVDSANENLVILQGLRARYTATSTELQRFQILSEFEDLQASGNLHDEIAIAAREFELLEARAVIRELKELFEDACGSVIDDTRNRDTRN